MTKVANVASVPEPGGPVTYTVTVTNTSITDAVEIEKSAVLGALSNLNVYAMCVAPPPL